MKNRNIQHIFYYFRLGQWNNKGEKKGRKRSDEGRRQERSEQGRETQKEGKEIDYGTKVGEQPRDFSGFTVTEVCLVLSFSSFTHSLLLWSYGTSPVGTFTWAKQEKTRMQSQAQSLNASSKTWHTSLPLCFTGQSKSHDHTWLPGSWKYNPPVCLEASEKQMLVMPSTSRRMGELVLREGKRTSLLPSPCSPFPWQPHLLPAGPGHHLPCSCWQPVFPFLSSLPYTPEMHVTAETACWELTPAVSPDWHLLIPLWVCQLRAKYLAPYPRTLSEKGSHYECPF